MTKDELKESIKAGVKRVHEDLTVAASMMMAARDRWRTLEASDPEGVVADELLEGDDDFKAMAYGIDTLLAEIVG